MSEPNPSDTPKPPAPAPTPPDAALNAALEKVRQEERIRYDQERARLEKENQAAKQAVADLTSKMELLTKAQEAAGSGKPIAEIVEGAVAQVSTRLQQEFGGRLSEVQQQLAAEKSRREAAELAQLRTRLISEAGGASAMIVELVTGTNEEELKQSIADSKVRLTRVLEQAGLKPGAAKPEGTPNPPNPPPSPAGEIGTDQLAKVRGMSMEDYRKQRMALRAAVAGRYAQPPGA